MCGRWNAVRRWNLLDRNVFVRRTRGRLTSAECTKTLLQSVFKVTPTIFFALLTFLISLRLPLEEDTFPVLLVRAKVLLATLFCLLRQLKLVRYLALELVEPFAALAFRVRIE